MGGGGRGVCDHSQSASVLRLSLPAPDCGLAGRLFGRDTPSSSAYALPARAGIQGSLACCALAWRDAWLRDVPGARLPCITVFSAFMYARKEARTVHRSPCADAWPHTRRAGRTCDHTSPLIGAGKCLDKLGWQGGTAPHSKSAGQSASLHGPHVSEGQGRPGPCVRPCPVSPVYMGSREAWGPRVPCVSCFPCVPGVRGQGLPGPCAPWIPHG